MEAALDIYQRHLDLVTGAFWDRDFATVVLETRFPHRMATSDGIEEITSPTAFREVAEIYRDRLDKMGATAFLRVCKAAAYAEGRDDRIDGVHKVYILAGGRQLIPAYFSELILLKEDGSWRGAGIREKSLSGSTDALRPPVGLLDSADF